MTPAELRGDTRWPEAGATARGERWALVHDTGDGKILLQQMRGRPRYDENSGGMVVRTALVFVLIICVGVAVKAEDKDGHRRRLPVGTASIDL